MRIKPTSDEVRATYNSLAFVHESQGYWDHFYRDRAERLINRTPDSAVEIDTRDQYFLSASLVRIGL